MALVSLSTNWLIIYLAVCSFKILSVLNSFFVLNQFYSFLISLFKYLDYKYDIKLFLNKSIIYLEYTYCTYLFYTHLNGDFYRYLVLNTQSEIHANYVEFLLYTCVTYASRKNIYMYILFIRFQRVKILAMSIVFHCPSVLVLI